MEFLLWLYLAVFVIAFVAILVGYFWTIVLYVAGGRFSKKWRDEPPGPEQDYLWVFMVPALNEAVTIADSVTRLRSVNASNKLILVINDGSDDGTGEVLDEIAGTDLVVLTRQKPNAQKGKAAALNHAFAYVRDEVLQRPDLAHFTHDDVIFGIVDADGRLDPDAPKYVSRHFVDPNLGGVQLSVEIYNKDNYIARMQGLEFEVFGGLYQVGRSEWGAAFMGGNGQFNRMSALESIAVDGEPWSHFLTEDQELGLRLLERGWRAVHETAASVSQQGLSSLRPLYRQRTRWLQGNLQVLGSLGRLHAHHLTGIRRVDALFTLILPVLQIIVGVALAMSILMAVVFRVPYFPTGNVWLTIFYIQLALGPTALTVLVIGRGRGIRGVWRVVVNVIPYIVYTWVMWPVVFIGLYKQLRGNQTWAKTERESITPEQSATIEQ